MIWLWRLLVALLLAVWGVWLRLVWLTYGPEARRRYWARRQARYLRQQRQMPRRP